MAFFRQSALERNGLDVNSPARRQWEHSACCAVAMVRISPNWQYNLSTPSMEGGGSVSRSVTVAATFWLALAMAGRYPSRG
jgi:hypothetical protein